jgi:hypothetical protein
MTDRVEFELYLGLIGRAANAVIVRRLLAQIFDFRQHAIESLLGGSSSGADPPRPPAFTAQSVT